LSSHQPWSAPGVYCTADGSLIRGEEEGSVKVKCFGCDALIEADDSDAVADAFVAHGQRHLWQAWRVRQAAERAVAA
jgi:hypothetical protein